MKQDVWVICPPKDHDIQFNDETKEYSLQYIKSEDEGITVDIVNNVSRKRSTLSRLVTELKTLAKYRISQGLPVTNERVYHG
tara:strand:- start:117 stop:362 length:246 start_codon:yes stop_codon:yes gene_type:complete